MAQEPRVITISIDSLLGMNREFHNAYAGKRCFVLGNGPSLKAVDLSLLADEYVLTVSFFNYVKDFQAAKPNWEVIYDPAFLKLDNGIDFQKRALQVFHDFAPLKTTFFCLVSAFPFIKNYRLDELVNVRYIMNDNIPIHANAPLALDIDKPIRGFWNVVQAAITIAMYMGFSEIYLLGVDATTILGAINSLLNQPLDDHAYDNEWAKTTDIKKEKPSYSITEMFFYNYLMFLGYDKLSYACKTRNIKLINCSAQTIITQLPRMDLMEVLKQKS